MFYEGVEDLSLYSPQQLEEYRSMLLRKTEPQSAFIKQIVGRERFSAYELCCGNGRLLVDLTQRGSLVHGAGVDGAESRIAFGRKWLSDLGIRTVDLRYGDVLEQEGGEEYDVAVCLTGAFQYFPRTLGEGDAFDVLLSMKEHAPVCILEIYNIPESRLAMLALNGGVLRTWDTLPDADPFAYYMDSYSYNSNNRSMIHDKVFIRRGGGIDAGRTEVLYYYTTGELECLMREVGYTSVEFYPQGDRLLVVGKV